MPRIMKKEILLIIIVLFNSVFCMAQDASGKIAQKDIDRLNKLALDDKSKSLFSKPLCDTPFIVNIFHVYDPLKPNRADIRTDIEDGTFLRRIEPSYYKVRKRLVFQKKILNSDVILFCPDNEYIGFFSEGKFGYIKSKCDYQIAKIAIENKLISIYRVTKVDARYLIGINSNKDVYILRINWDESVTICSAKDYIDDEWPYLFDIDEHGYSVSKHSKSIP